nr:hypothetical transcript [Hymenolepis microstoma]
MRDGMGAKDEGGVGEGMCGRSEPLRLGRSATQFSDPDANSSYQSSLPASANNALRLQRDPVVHRNPVAKSVTYHRTYGDNTKKCQPGCNYPKFDSAISESNTTGPEVGVNTRVLQKSAFFSSPISPYKRQTTN